MTAQLAIFPDEPGGFCGPLEKAHQGLSQGAGYLPDTRLLSSIENIAFGPTE